MKGSSFRDILAEFLEEKSEFTAQEAKRFQAEPTPLLQWKRENLRQIPNDSSFAVKNGYSRPTPRKTMPVREEKPAEKSPVAQEHIIKRDELSAEAQMAAVVLIVSGAAELEGGISSARLKKAHRRLIKTLHPDRNQGADKNAFLKVQSAYEILGQELKRLTLRSSSSDSASDSGSASEQGSQRRDAA